MMPARRMKPTRPHRTAHNTRGDCFCMACRRRTTPRAALLGLVQDQCALCGSIGTIVMRTPSKRRKFIARVW
jgi:hypothetical protein